MTSIVYPLRLSPFLSLTQYIVISKEEGEYTIKIIPDPCGENFGMPYCLRGTDLADIYEIIDVFRVCTLLHQLQKVGTENLGTAMIFAISEAVREYLVNINEPRNMV